MSQIPLRKRPQPVSITFTPAQLKALYAHMNGVPVKCMYGSELKAFREARQKMYQARMSLGERPADHMTHPNEIAG